MRQYFEKMEEFGAELNKGQILSSEENVKNIKEVEAGIDAEVVKVTDLNEIMGFGVMVTPALAIDGVVKATGKVPTPEAIKEMIQ